MKDQKRFRRASQIDLLHQHLAIAKRIKTQCTQRLTVMLVIDNITSSHVTVTWFNICCALDVLTAINLVQLCLIFIGIGTIRESNLTCHVQLFSPLKDP